MRRWETRQGGSGAGIWEKGDRDMELPSLPTLQGQNFCVISGLQGLGVGSRDKMSVVYPRFKFFMP